MSMQETRPRSSVLSRTPLGFPWQTSDPFLFCVHHNDAYPAGNEAMGPAASLEGRNIGQDFAGKDGWSMYHGEVVPGFPQHPHRGFETVTLVRKGFIDHSDSLGATARFGEGDAQWLTAGRGINHCEMFPLRKRDADNPAELFQIWLNLPRASKMVEPYFSMFWRDAIPRRELKDRMGRAITLLLVAGKLEDGGALGERQPPLPPPDSWASNPASALAIWTIRLSPGAEWTLPPAPPGTTRNLYFFRGSALTISGEAISPRTAVGLVPDMETPIVNGNDESELLLLQGRPIGEPVVQHGPFVMNTVDEIQKAFFDYRNTRFGGWPWPHDAPVHPRDEGRFAKYPDGRVERPQQ